MVFCESPVAMTVCSYCPPHSMFIVTFLPPRTHTNFVLAFTAYWKFMLQYAVMKYGVFVIFQDCLAAVHESVTKFALFWMQVLDRHKAMDNMVELLQVYTQEDEAYGELLEATTQLYHYLLQPFRDMREVAMLHRQQIKVIHQTRPQIPSVLGLDLVGLHTLFRSWNTLRIEFSGAVFDPETMW